MAAEPIAEQELVDGFVRAAHGDLRRVKDLLAWQSGILNARATWDETAIQAAAHTGRVDIAEFLLSVGAPLDLCTAAMLGLRARVDLYLRNRPGLARSTGAHCLPALYFAAIRGHCEIADLLAAHGAEVDAVGGAPLKGAVQFNQPSMVAWLLDHGANPEGPGQPTPLAIAREHGLVEVERVLRSRAAYVAGPAD